jgi:hypothetical protein
MTTEAKKKVIEAVKDEMDLTLEVTDITYDNGTLTISLPEGEWQEKVEAYKNSLTEAINSWGIEGVQVNDIQVKAF